MSILGAVIVPHPPLIIPTVGRGREQEVQAENPDRPIRRMGQSTPASRKKHSGTKVPWSRYGSLFDYGPGPL